MQKFSKKEVIQTAWKVTRENLGSLVGIVVAVGVIQYIPSLISESLKEKSQFGSFLFGLIAWFVQMYMSIGVLTVALKVSTGEKPNFQDLFKVHSVFGKYLGGSILYGLICFVGFILLIIPGIIWSIQFQFFSYLIVDQGLGPIEALKKSSELTKGSKWDLFLLGLMLLGVILLGFICFLVGLLVAIPTVMIAGAFVYRILLNHTAVEVRS